MSQSISSILRPQVELDILEVWVNDLGTTKRTLMMFGFESCETGLKSRPEEEIECLTCGKVSLLLRKGMSPANPIARHVAAHGDSIGDVALVCDEVSTLLDLAIAHGLKVSNESECPRIDLLGDGTMLHSVRDRRVVTPPNPPKLHSASQIRAIDHITYCVPWGMMDRIASVYREVFGLEHVFLEDCARIGDNTDGMRSIVLRSSLGFTVVLTEPMGSESTCQTQHFLHAHGGAGVQHIALAYDDLVTAVGSLRSEGIPFLSIPEEHLELSHQRLRDRPLSWEALRRFGILVDTDERGLLFQLFTRPITSRGSFFVELIQREGTTGFGINNVRALFAALSAATPQFGQSCVTHVRR